MTAGCVVSKWNRKTLMPLYPCKTLAKTINHILPSMFRKDESKLEQTMSISRTYGLVRKMVYLTSKKKRQICFSRINEKIMWLIYENVIVV